MDGVSNRRLRYVKFCEARKRYGERSQVLIVTTALDIECKDAIQNNESALEYRKSGIQQSEESCQYGSLFLFMARNSVEAILYLMFIASNLFQLFKTKRLKNHVPVQIELIRLLHRGLYQTDRKNNLISEHSLKKITT